MHRLEYIGFKGQKEGEVFLNITADKDMWVLSGDIRGDVEPTDDDIVLCKLKAGGRLVFDATLSIGKESLGTKWSHVHTFTYTLGFDRTVKVCMRTGGNIAAEDILLQTTDPTCYTGV